MPLKEESGIPTRSVSLAGRGSVGAPKSKLIDSWQKKTTQASEEPAPGPARKPWQQSSSRSIGSISNRFGGAGNGASKFGPSKFGANRSGSNTPPSKEQSPSGSKKSSPTSSVTVTPSASKAGSPSASKVSSPGSSKAASPGTSKRSIPVRVSPRSSPGSKRKSPKTSPKLGRKSPPRSPGKKSPRIPRSSRFGALKAKGFKGVLKDVGVLKQRIERVKEFVRKHNKISEIQKELLISAIDNESYTCKDLQLVIFAGPDLQAKFTLPGKDPSNPKVLHKSTKQFIQLAVSKLKFPQHVKDKLSQAINDDNCEISLSKVTILIKSGATTQNITLNLPGVLYPQIIQRETNIATSTLIEVVDKFTVEKEMTADERNSVLSSIYNNNYVLDGRRLSVLVKDGDRRKSVDFDVDPTSLAEKESGPSGTTLPYFYVPENVSDDEIKEIMIKTISESTIDTESMQLAIKAIKHGRYRREGNKILIEGFKRDSLTSSDECASSPELSVKILRNKKLDEPSKPFSASIEATTLEPQELNEEMENFKFKIRPLSSEMIQLKHKIIKVITMLSIEDRLKIELINKIIDDDFKIDENVITIKSTKLTLIFLTMDYEITDVKIAYGNNVSVAKYIPIRIVILGTDAIKQSKFNEEKKKLLVEKFYMGNYVEDRGSVKISIAYNRIPVRFSFGIPKPDVTIPDIPKDELKVKVINDLSTSDLTQKEQDQVLQSLLNEDYTLVDTDVVFKIGVPIRSYRVRLIVDNSATSTPNTTGSPAVGTPLPQVITKQDDVVLEEVGPSDFDHRPINDAVREKLKAVIMASDFDEETKTILLTQLAKLTYFKGDTVTIESTKADGTPVRFTINCKFTHEVVFVDSGEGVHKDKKQKVEESVVEDVPMLAEDTVPVVEAVAAEPVKHAPKVDADKEPTKVKVPITPEMRVFLIESIKSSQFDQETKDLLIIQLNELSYITGDVVELTTTKSDGTPVKLTLNYSSSDAPTKNAEKRVPSPEENAPAKKVKLPADLSPQSTTPEESAEKPTAAPSPQLADVIIKKDGSTDSTPMTDEIRIQLIQSLRGSNLDTETLGLLEVEIHKLDSLDRDKITLKTVKKDGTPVELTINVSNIVTTHSAPVNVPVLKDVTMSAIDVVEDIHMEEPKEDSAPDISIAPVEAPLVKDAPKPAPGPSAVNKTPKLDEEDVPMPGEDVAPRASEEVTVSKPKDVPQQESVPSVSKPSPSVEPPSKLDDVSVVRKLSPDSEPSQSIPMTDDIRDQLLQSIRMSNLDSETKNLLEEEINKLECLDSETIKLKTKKKDGTPVELTINVKNIIEAVTPQKEPVPLPQGEPSSPALEEEDVPMSEDEVSPQVEEDIPMQEEKEVKIKKSLPGAETPSKPQKPVSRLDDVSVTRKLASPGTEPSESIPMTDEIRDQLSQSIDGSNLDDETKALLKDEINKLEALDGDTITLKTAKKDGTPIELTINVKNIVESNAPGREPVCKKPAVLTHEAPVEPPKEAKSAAPAPTFEEEDVPMSDEDLSLQTEEDVPIQKPKVFDQVKSAPKAPEKVEIPKKPSMAEEDVLMSDDEVTPEVEEDIPVQEEKKVEPKESTPDSPNDKTGVLPSQGAPKQPADKPVAHLDDVSVTRKLASPGAEPSTSIPMTDDIRHQLNQSIDGSNLDDETKALLKDEINKLEALYGDTIKLNAKKKDGTPIELTINVKNIVESVAPRQEQVSKKPVDPAPTAPEKVEVKKEPSMAEEDVPMSDDEVTPEVEEDIPIQEEKKVEPKESTPDSPDDKTGVLPSQGAPKQPADKPVAHLDDVSVTRKLKSPGTEPSTSIPMTDDIRHQLNQSIDGSNLDDETKALLKDEVNKLEALDGDTIKLNATKKDGTAIELTINVKNIVESVAPRQERVSGKPTESAPTAPEKEELTKEPTMAEEDVPMSDEEITPKVEEDIPVQEEKKVEPKESMPDSPDDKTGVLPSQGAPKQPVDKPVAHLDDVSVTRKLASPGTEPSTSIPMTDDIRDQLNQSIDGSNLDDETKALLKDEINKLEALDGDTIKLNATKKDGTPIELTINVKNIVESVAPPQEQMSGKPTESAPAAPEKEDLTKEPTMAEEDVPMSDDEVTPEVEEDIPVQEEKKVEPKESTPDSPDDKTGVLPSQGAPKQPADKPVAHLDDVSVTRKLASPGTEPSTSIPMTDDIRDQLNQSIDGSNLDDETKALLKDEVNKLQALDGDTIKLNATKKDGTPIELTINVKNIVESVAPPQERVSGKPSESATMAPEKVEVPKEPSMAEEDVPMSDEEITPEVEEDIPVQEEKKVEPKESTPDSPDDKTSVLSSQGAPKQPADKPVAHLDDVSVTRKLASPGTEPSTSIPMTDDIRDQLNQSIDGSNLDDETKALLKDEVNKLEALDGDTIKLNATKKDGTPIELTINVKNIVESVAPPQERVSEKPTESAPAAPEKVEVTKEPSMAEEDVPMSDEEITPEVEEDIPVQEEKKVEPKESTPDSSDDKTGVLPSQGAPKQPADKPVAHLDDVSVTRKLASPGAEPSTSIPMTDDIRDQLNQSIDGSNLDDETKTLLKDEVNKLEALDGDTIKLNATKKDGTPIELTINVKNIVESVGPRQVPASKKPTELSPEAIVEPSKEAEKTAAAPGFEEEDVPMSDEDVSPETGENVPIQKPKVFDQVESAPKAPEKVEPTVAEEDVPMSDDEVTPEVEEDIPVQEEKKVEPKKSTPDSPDDKTGVLPRQEAPKQPGDKPVAHLDDVSVTRKLASPGTEPSTSIPMTDDIRNQLNQSIDGSNLDDETKALLKDEVNKLEALDGDTIKLNATKKDGTPIELTINVRNIVESVAPRQEPVSKKPAVLSPEAPVVPSKEAESAAPAPTFEEEDVPMSDEDLSLQTEEDVPIQKPKVVDQVESAPMAPEKVEVTKEPTVAEEDVPMSDNEDAPKVEEDIPVQEEKKIEPKESTPEETQKSDNSPEKESEAPSDSAPAVVTEEVEEPEDEGKTHVLSDAPAAIPKVVVEPCTPVESQPTIPGIIKKVDASPEEISPDSEEPDEDKHEPLTITNDLREQLIESVKASPLDEETVGLLEDEIRKLETLAGDAMTLSATKKDGTPVELTININQIIKASDDASSDSESSSSSDSSDHSDKEEDIVNLGECNLVVAPLPQSGRRISTPVTDELRAQILEALACGDLDEETIEIFKKEIEKLDEIEGDQVKLTSTKPDGTPVELTINVKNILRNYSAPEQVPVEPAKPVLIYPIKISQEITVEGAPESMTDVTEEMKDNIKVSLKSSDLDEESIQLLSVELEKLVHLKDDVVAINVVKSDGTPVEMIINVKYITKETIPLPTVEDEVADLPDISKKEDIPKKVKVKPVKSIEVEPIKLQEAVKVMSSPEAGKPVCTPLTDDIKSQIIASLKEGEHPVDKETITLMVDELNKREVLEGDSVTLNAKKKDGTPVELTINIKHVTKHLFPAVPSDGGDDVADSGDDTKVSEVEEQLPEKVVIKPAKPTEVAPLKVPTAPDVDLVDEMTPTNEEHTPTNIAPETKPAPSVPMTDDIKNQILETLKGANLDDETMELLSDEVDKIDNLEGDKMKLSAEKKDGTPIDLTINISHITKIISPVSSDDGFVLVEIPDDEPEVLEAPTISPEEKPVTESAPEKQPIEVNLSIQTDELSDQKDKSSLPISDNIRSKIVDTLKQADLEEEVSELLVKEVDKLTHLESDKVKVSTKKADGTPVHLTINVSHLTRHLVPVSTKEDEGYELVEAEKPPQQSAPSEPLLVEEEPLVEDTTPEESGVDDLTVEMEAPPVVKEVPVEPVKQEKVPVTEDIKSQIMESLVGADLDTETLDLLKEEVEKLENLEGDQVKLDTKKKDGTPISLTINISHITRHIAPVPMSDEEGYELVDAAEEPKTSQAAEEEPIMEEIPMEESVNEDISVEKEEPPAVEEVPGEPVENRKVPVTDDIKSQIMDSLKGARLDDEALGLLEDEIDKLDALEGDQIKLDTKKKDGTPISLTINVSHITRHIKPKLAEEEDSYELVLPADVAPVKKEVPVEAEEEPVVTPITDAIKAQILLSLQSGEFDDETMKLLEEELEKIESVEDGKMEIAAKKKDGTPINLTVNIDNITKKIVPVPMEEDEGYELIESAPVAVKCDLQVPQEDPAVISDIPVTDDIKSQIADNLASSGLDQETIDLLRDQLSKLLNLNGDTVELKTYKKDGTPIDFTINIHRITKTTVPVPTEEESAEPVPGTKKVIPITLEIRAQILETLKSSDLDEETLDLLEKEIDELETLEGDSINLKTAKKDGSPISLTINLEHITRKIVPKPLDSEDAPELLECEEMVPCDDDLPTVEEDVKEQVERVPIAMELPVSLACIGKDIRAVPIGMEDYGYALEYPKAPKEESLVPSGQFLAVHTELTDKIKEEILALDIPEPAKENLITELDNGNMMACGANGLIKTTLKFIEPVATLVNLTLPDSPSEPQEIVADFSPSAEDEHAAEEDVKSEEVEDETGPGPLVEVVVDVLDYCNLDEDCKLKVSIVIHHDFTLNQEHFWLDCLTFKVSLVLSALII